MTSESVIDVRDLRMRYGTTDVLTGVSFTAERGEVLALLGPNGAGKTTTIEILEGFRIRSAGQVSVLGMDPGHGTEAWRARLGVVLQSWRDHSKWRVRQLLAHLGSYYANFPAWLQGVAQVFPIYWLGLGMRSALLPDDMAAVEFGHSWRHLETAGVLSAWAVVGLILAPIVLRRMARRESGSSVAARREKALQRIT
jgi:ABC-type Fe3+/spermidine/putrescine transport system ATPase subunit